MDRVSDREPMNWANLAEMVERGARALWKIGNERIGERPWEQVADHYRRESAACIHAAMPVLREVAERGRFSSRLEEAIASHVARRALGEDVEPAPWEVDPG